MKCEICGNTPDNGATLFRQNPKGVTGIWRCECCLQEAPNREVAQIVAEIQHVMCTKSQEAGDG